MLYYPMSGAIGSTAVRNIGERLHPVFLNLAEHALADGNVALFRFYFALCTTIYKHIMKPEGPTNDN